MTAELPHGFRLLSLESCASTNDEAKRAAEAGAAEGLLVTAARQSAGRGRYGRRWDSPPGNLYLSALLRPRRPLAATSGLALAAGLAVADSLAEWDLAARLKWPNDVLLGGAKVAGVLLEAGGDAGGECRWLVVGIGVNVATRPPQPLYPATCLAAHGVRAPVSAVLVACARHLASWYGVWLRSGLAPVRAAWLERAHGLGGPVRLRLENGEVDGTFVGLTEAGALLLRRPNGVRRSIDAGDVFFAGLPRHG